MGFWDDNSFAGTVYEHYEPDDDAPISWSAREARARRGDRDRHGWTRESRTYEDCDGTGETSWGGCSHCGGGGRVTWTVPVER